MALYLSGTVKEQGTVTQDPLSVVTLSGTTASNIAELHPSPLKQGVDKTKDSIDAQTLTKYSNLKLNFLTKNLKDNLSVSMNYY